MAEAVCRQSPSAVTACKRLIQGARSDNAQQTLVSEREEFYGLGLSLGASLLMAAVLAPTDPVLASDVQVAHTKDRDSLRFTLTCEAGMNDGTAFPFVMLGLGLLGLHDLGEAGLRWVLVDVLWGIGGGIGIGVLAGVALARLGSWLRGGPQRHELLNDFLGLGLIAVVYGLCLQLHAWGFLAVFCAAVALRQTEMQLASRAAPAAEVDGQVAPGPETPSSVSQGSLVFKEQKVVRFYDEKRNALVYLTYSTKLVDGSYKSAVSAVPIMPWG